MDYRIVNRDAFPVIGKSILVTCKDGEGFRRIPKFWEECHIDGTIERLYSLCPGKDILGVKMDMDQDKEQFTYAIAVEGTVATLEKGLTTRDIPTSTWAVFTSIGPLPNAIQEVWLRIFQEWFPATGYQHANGPELEVCPPGDIGADDYRCEVWIPVVKN